MRTRIRTRTWRGTATRQSAEREKGSVRQSAETELDTEGRWGSAEPVI